MLRHARGSKAVGRTETFRPYEDVCELLISITETYNGGVTGLGSDSISGSGGKSGGLGVTSGCGGCVGFGLWGSGVCPGPPLIGIMISLSVIMAAGSQVLVVELQARAMTLG